MIKSREGSTIELNKPNFPVAMELFPHQLEFDPQNLTTVAWHSARKLSQSGFKRQYKLGEDLGEQQTTINWQKVPGITPDAAFGLHLLVQWQLVTPVDLQKIITDMSVGTYEWGITDPQRPVRSFLESTLVEFNLDTWHTVKDGLLLGMVFEPAVVNPSSRRNLFAQPLAIDVIDALVADTVGNLDVINAVSELHAQKGYLYKQLVAAHYHQKPPIAAENLLKRNKYYALARHLLTILGADLTKSYHQDVLRRTFDREVRDGSGFIKQASNFPSSGYEGIACPGQYVTVTEEGQYRSAMTALLDNAGKHVDNRGDRQLLFEIRASERSVKLYTFGDCPAFKDVMGPISKKEFQEFFNRVD